MNLDLGARQLPNESATTPGQLSVSYSRSQITESVLSAVWNKASQHLTKPDSFEKFFVYSPSKLNNPNVVTVGGGGKRICSCLMYRSTPNICSHSVAVAEREKNLRNFLSWIAKSGDPNLCR